MFVDPYLSNITIFAGNFAPQNWAFCNGALLSIAENTPLFALIGTTYGGDGINTFALPDLRGRTGVGTGQAPGLPGYVLGQPGGSESTTLLAAHLPAHTHPLVSISGAAAGAADSGNQSSPAAAVPADVSNRYSSGGADGTMATTVVNTQSVPAGGNTPVSNVTPYLAMNYIICTVGIFPSRP